MRKWDRGREIKFERERERERERVNGIKSRVRISIVREMTRI